MTDAPFFEPWPEPGLDQDDHQSEIDLPWMPPVHVVGAVVPVAATVHRSDDVMVQLTHVVACRRGLELHLGTWVRPGARRDLSGPHDVWQEQEPRVGVRLADGTRLGHHPPHLEAPEDAKPARTTFTQTSGNGGGLHSRSSWWVHPLPEGDAMDLLVLWEHQNVPECSVSLDLGPLRAAAEREQVLWDPPPAPGDEGVSFGWFGYAPMSGTVYASDLRLDLDEDAVDAEPDDDAT